MTPRLTPHERETVFRTCDGERAWHVCTEQRSMVTKLKALVRKYPTHTRVLADETNTHGQPRFECVLPIEFVSAHSSRAAKFKAPAPDPVQG